MNRKFNKLTRISLITICAFVVFCAMVCSVSFKAFADDSSNEYRINFISNKSDNSQTAFMETITCHFGQDVQLPKCDWTNNGEDFTYWSVGQNSSKIFKNEAVVNFNQEDLSDKNTKQIDLFANYGCAIIDFKCVATDKGTFDYCPVFDNLPEGVIMCSADGKTTFTSMNKDIAYAVAPLGTQIKAVRSMNNVSWEKTFKIADESDSDKTVSYPCHADKELVQGADSTAERLVFGEDVVRLSDINENYNYSPITPKIFDDMNADVWTVWNIYNPDKQADMFGGASGLFWSDVATRCNNSAIWFSHDKIWIPGGDGNRKGSGQNLYLLIASSFEAK